MFDDLVENQYVANILNQHPKDNCTRISRAIFIFGAKQLWELHPKAIIDLGALEEIAYESDQAKRKLSPIEEFFDELKTIKENLNKLDKKMANNTKESPKINTKRVVGKENKLKHMAIENSHTPKRIGSSSELEDQIKENGRKNMLIYSEKTKAPEHNLLGNPKAVKLVFEKKEFTKPYQNRIPQPLVITKSNEQNTDIAEKPIVPKIASCRKKQRTTLKRQEPIITPKYLNNVQIGRAHV